MNLVETDVVPELEVEDSIIWTDEVNGDLSLKLAYGFYQKQISSRALYFFPWDKSVSPSESMLIWRIAHDKMPTNEHMTVGGFRFPSMCSLCRDNIETTSHILFHCKYVINIWN